MVEITTNPTKEASIKLQKAYDVNSEKCKYALEKEFAPLKKWGMRTINSEKAIPL